MGVHFPYLFGAYFEYQIWARVVLPHPNIQNDFVVDTQLRDINSRNGSINENI